MPHTREKLFSAFGGVVFKNLKKKWFNLHELKSEKLLHFLKYLI